MPTAPRGTCQCCGKSYQITVNGLIPRHASNQEWGTEFCPGSDAAPFEQSCDRIVGLLSTVAQQLAGFRALRRELRRLVTKPRAWMELQVQVEQAPPLRFWHEVDLVEREGGMCYIGLDGEEYVFPTEAGEDWLDVATRLNDSYQAVVFAEITRLGVLLSSMQQRLVAWQVRVGEAAGEAAA